MPRISLKTRLLDTLKKRPGEILSSVELASILGQTYLDYVAMAARTLINEGQPIEVVKRPGHKRWIQGYKWIGTSDAVPDQPRDPEKKMPDLQSEMGQLSVLLNEVPDEEEAVVGLREAVIEQLHPLLGKALGDVKMEIEFPGPFNPYFLGVRGWRTKLSSRGISSRRIAESCTEETLRTSLTNGVEKLIEEMKRRGEEASNEKAKLLKLLSCFAELQQ